MNTRDHPTIGLVVPDANADDERARGQLVDFEAHRSLVPALTATIADLDATAIKEFAINGARLHIEHLMNQITAATAARDGTMKAAYETKLAAAHRQFELVRAWDGRVSR